MTGTNGLNVRRAGPGDEPVVRSLRLQALSDDPVAFDSDLRTEMTWTSADWREWMSRGATFVLEGAEGPAGIAACVPHWTDSGAAFLMSMWVHPGGRGTGGADALVD